MNDSDCAKGRENETNIKGLQEDVTTIMDWIRRLEDKIDKALEMAAKRPGWPVCIMMSILLAACAVLGTLLAAHISSGG